MALDSFRIRLVALYAAITLATLVLFRLTSIHVVKELLYEELDRSLQAEAVAILDLLGENSLSFTTGQVKEKLLSRARLNPRKELIEIWNASNVLYYSTPNIEAGQILRPDSTIPGKPAIREIQGKALRVTSLSDRGWTVIVGHPLSDIEAAVRKMLVAMFLMLPLAVVIIVDSGLLIVTSFLKPLKELNRSWARIIDHPLNEEVVLERNSGDGEIGTMVDQFHTVVARMRSGMRRVLSFSALTSHELRRPLAVLRSELEQALEPGVTQEKVILRVASAYDETLRMSHTVEDLLSLCTLEAGTFTLDRAWVNIGSFISEFYEEVSLLGAERGIVIGLDGGEDITAWIDGERIRQVLFNLIDNAIKNVNDGGRVWIAYRLTGDRVAIEVRDNGKGIPEYDLNHVFDSFYRGSEPCSGGTGLGLTLVKLIVEAHKGRVEVESASGRGTAFTIYLPEAVTDPERLQSGVPRLTGSERDSGRSSQPAESRPA